MPSNANQVAATANEYSEYLRTPDSGGTKPARTTGVMDPARIVHVVDDDPDRRRSLEELLLSAGFTPILYPTPFALLNVASSLVEGCLLLDVCLRGMSGLELQERLAEQNVVLPVVVMMGEADIATAVRAMKAGAVDFIEKPFDDERLIRALEAALTQPRSRGRQQAVAEASRRVASLSRRERQVLDALVAGLSNKAIAKDLSISVRTVEVHRARMLRRLGTHRLADAIRFAVIASLADSDER